MTAAATKTGSDPNTKGIIRMNTIQKMLVPGLISMLMAAPVYAQAISQAITKEDYKLQKDNIEKTHDADKAKCKKLMGNQRDVCVVEADAKEDVAKAELEAAYKNTGKERIAAAKVRAKAAFDVDKERCDDQKGDAKSLCVTQAEAKRDRALADVEARKEVYKAHKDINEAQKDAREEKMDATYEAEMKKCDSYAGDAKDACEVKVKQRFNK
ncbi:MAG: hypothetical protein ACAH18_01725 [Methylophilaceae bacterium]|jgi:hypothetical protein